MVSYVKVLSPYNPALPLQLFCGTSRAPSLLGYVLAQPQGEKVNVLQCGSTTLTSAQCGYSIVELELLSVVGSLEKSSFFLKGAHNVQVFSDHAPLCGLERKDLSSIGNQHIVHMLEISRGFCFSLHYIKGIKNAFADCLSRQPRQNVEQAEEFAHFGSFCTARKVFGVEGNMVPEHREDVQVMADGRLS